MSEALSSVSRSVNQNSNFEIPTGSDENQLRARITTCVSETGVFKENSDVCPTSSNEMLKRDGLDPSKFKLKKSFKPSFTAAKQKDIRLKLIKEAFDVVMEIQNDCKPCSPLSLLNYIIAITHFYKAALKINSKEANTLFNDALDCVDNEKEPLQCWSCLPSKDDLLNCLAKAKAPVDPKGANNIALKITIKEKRLLAFIYILIDSPLEAIQISMSDGITFADKDLQQKPSKDVSLTNLLMAYETACQINNPSLIEYELFTTIGKALIPIDPKEAQKCLKKMFEILNKFPQHEFYPYSLFEVMAEIEPVSNLVKHSKYSIFVSKVAMGKAHIQSDPETAEMHFKEAFEDFEKFDDLDGRRALSIFIQAKAPIINPQEAEKIAEQIHSYQFPYFRALTFIELGKALMQRYPKQAAKYFYEAHKLSETIDRLLKVEILCKLSHHFIYDRDWEDQTSVQGKKIR